MSNFGIPFMGSKDKIAEIICRFLPAADNFYDLFGGGFSITDCMLQVFSKKYKNFFFNEIEPSTVNLIRDAINGKYNYDKFQPEWVDREMFAARKDTCAYTRIGWSFGNNQKDYIFGKQIEEQKKALHNAVVFNKFNPLAEDLLKIKSFHPALNIKSRRLLSRRIIASQKNRCDLERLQQLEQLERLELTSLSYDQVKIKDNSIIYCDPPYQGTASYLKSFNHGKFFDWVRTQLNPVFFSEYTAPVDFDIALSITKGTSLSGGFTESKAEKLFVNQAAKELLHAKDIKTYINRIQK